MKRFLLASLLALPVLGLSQQTASAWHEFHFNLSFSVECTRGCGWNSCFNCCCNRYADRCRSYSTCASGYDMGCSDGYCPSGYGGMDYSADVAPYSDPGYPAPTMSSTVPSQIPNYYHSGYQPVGYFQAPAYWYGR